MTVMKSVLFRLFAVAMATMVASCETASYAPNPDAAKTMGVSEARSIVRHTLLSLPSCRMLKGNQLVDTQLNAVHLTATSLSVNFSDSSALGPYQLKDINPSVGFVNLGGLGDSDTVISVLSKEQAWGTPINDLAICEVRGDHTKDPAVQHLIDALLVLKQAAANPALDKDDDAHFTEIAVSYRAKATKPQLPEDARRFKVQAEAAIHDNDFANAADDYAKALEVAPWWPEGHFDRALVLAQSDDYAEAITEMKRYLLLVPNASDARASQDKIYEWERKAPEAN
jgi:tetratricopeptide (TPR) repeat protein